jgi:hypothetical protein
MPPMKHRSVLLATLFGLSSLSLLPLLPSPIAQASVARQELRVDRLKDEPYTAFVSRSELIARAAIQRTFDRDLLASSVVVYIMGLHQGSEAPVMSVEVTRSQWQQRPLPSRWATYYRMSQVLLGFGSSPTPVLEGPSTPPGIILQQPVSVPLSAPATKPASPVASPTASPTAPKPSRRSRKGAPVPSASASPTPAATPAATPTPVAVPSNRK